MKKSIAASLASLCLGLSALAQPVTASAGGVLGVLDPATGAFTVVRPKAAPSAAAAVSPTTGRLIVTLNITVKSAIAVDKPIYCLVTASVQEVDSSFNVNMYTETGSAQATRNSATSATCKVQLPYLWGLSTPTADAVSTTYTVSSEPGTAAVTSRTSTGVLDQFLVPASGQITNKSASVWF